jgi:hypothetical protein
MAGNAVVPVNLVVVQMPSKLIEGTKVKGTLSFYLVLLFILLVAGCSSPKSVRLSSKGQGSKSKHEEKTAND